MNINEPNYCLKTSEKFEYASNNEFPCEEKNRNESSEKDDYYDTESYKSNTPKPARKFTSEKLDEESLVNGVQSPVNEFIGQADIMLCYAILLCYVALSEVTKNDLPNGDGLSNNNTEDNSITMAVDAEGKWPDNSNGESPENSGSSINGAGSVFGNASAVGGIVTSRLSCTHLNLCKICLDACPGCEGVDETKPRSGEVVIRIVHSAPRRQLFPLAAVEPVGNIRADWLDNDSGQVSDFYGESSGEDENNSEREETPLVHGNNDSSDEGENNNEVDESPVVRGDNDEVDEELPVHSSMPSLASTSGVPSEGEDEDFGEEEMI